MLWASSPPIPIISYHLHIKAHNACIDFPHICTSNHLQSTDQRKCVYCLLLLSGTAGGFHCSHIVTSWNISILCHFTHAIALPEEMCGWWESSRYGCQPPWNMRTELCVLRYVRICPVSSHFRIKEHVRNQNNMHCYCYRITSSKHWQVKTVVVQWLVCSLHMKSSCVRGI